MALVLFEDDAYLPKILAALNIKLIWFHTQATNIFHEI